HVSTVEAIFSEGGAALFNPQKLQAAQSEIDSIAHDLNEINGAMNLAGAPLAAVSPTLRDYRLLVRMGYDLASSASEGLAVAATLLHPLQGGALGVGTASSAITPRDISEAQLVLGRAEERLQDALAAYHSLDMKALPTEFQSSGKFGKYLALLP